MKSGAVTAQRDLRTGMPFWLRHGDKHVPGRPLAANVTVDVAIVGAGVSGLPAIGAIPGAARCFAVMGYGGNGITFSVIAAQIIQRAILGLPDADAELFALP